MYYSRKVGNYMTEKEKRSITTLKHKVYEALLSDIINGVYGKDTLLTEKFLINKYNVSRSPIREALMQLTAACILSSIPRHGYKLTPISDTKLKEIVDLRRVLECGFLRAYYSYIQPHDIAKMRTFCSEYEATPKNCALTRWQMNIEFHLTLFSLYNNVHAYKVLKRELALQSLYYAIRSKSRAYTSDLHIAVIDYLEKGNIDMAVQLLKADIESILTQTNF